MRFLLPHRSNTIAIQPHGDNLGVHTETSGHTFREFIPQRAALRGIRHEPLMRYREAQPFFFPLRPALHQRILPGVQIDAREVRRDCRLHPVFGRQVIERDGIEPQIHLEERERIQRRPVFPQQFILRTQLRDLRPYVLHAISDATCLPCGACGCRRPDSSVPPPSVHTRALRGKKRAAPAGGSRCPPHRRDFPALQRCLIHEREFLVRGEAEEIRQPFQHLHVAGRRVHADHPRGNRTGAGLTARGTPGGRRRRCEPP